MELFPNGIWPYLAGGVLLGVAVSMIYLSTGIIAGASTFLESTLSFVFPDTFRAHIPSRNWRLIFTGGMVMGGLIYALTIGGGAWVTQVQWWRLFVGGVLVGFGTRLGKGCTSGHGICGVGSLSSASIVNVVIFVAVAIGTAQLVQ
ncbi:MAG: YeeE/YedE family protein, partial [Caldilineae bacterium]